MAKHRTAEEILAGLQKKYGVKAENTSSFQLAEGLEAKFTNTGFKITGKNASFDYNNSDIKIKNQLEHISGMNALLTINGNPPVEIYGAYKSQFSVWLVKDASGKVLAKASSEHYCPYNGLELELNHLKLARAAAEKAVRELQVTNVYNMYMKWLDNKTQTAAKTLQNYVSQPSRSKSGALPLRAQ
ncbi:MAG: hypothetical protein HY438_03795 [DPANN group archaeon]|nr:hypothetical protein [DPANN group archaeon]